VSLEIPVGEWLPSTDKPLFAPEMKGQRFWVRGLYMPAHPFIKNPPKQESGVVETSCPSCVIRGRRFKDWMLLP